MQLGTVLLEEGSEALGGAFQKQEAVGFIQMTGRLRYELRYSRQVQEGDTRRIILAADRPISFAETRAVGGARYGEYNISVVELRLDASGEGEGAIAPAVQIKIDEENKRLVIENYNATDALRLVSVRKQE